MRYLLILLFSFVLLEAFPDCQGDTRSVYLGYSGGTYDSATDDPEKLPIEKHYSSLYKRTTYDHFIRVHRYASDGSIESFYYMVKEDYYQCKKPYEHAPAPTCSAGTYPKLTQTSTGTYGSLGSSGGAGCSLSDFSSEYPRYSDMYNPNTNNEYYRATCKLPKTTHNLS